MRADDQVLVICLRVEYLLHPGGAGAQPEIDCKDPCPVEMEINEGHQGTEAPDVLAAARPAIQKGQPDLRVPAGSLPFFFSAGLRGDADLPQHGASILYVLQPGIIGDKGAVIITAAEQERVRPLSWGSPGSHPRRGIHPLRMHAAGKKNNKNDRENKRPARSQTVCLAHAFFILNTGLCLTGKLT